MNALLQRITEREQSLLDLVRQGKLDRTALALTSNWARALPGGDALAISSPTCVRQEADDGRMALTYVVSTRAVDSYGDIVEPRGCEGDLGEYAANPIVLLNHSRYNPVGLACGEDRKLALSIHEDRIISTVYFHGQTRENVQLYALAKAGVYGGASIGFVPRRAFVLKPPSEEPDLEKNEVDFDYLMSKWSRCYRFTKWRLKEWSLTCQPANTEAMKLALGGTIDGSPLEESLRREIEAYLPGRKAWDTGAARDAYVVTRDTCPTLEDTVVRAEAEGKDTSEVVERADGWEFGQPALTTPTPTPTTPTETRGDAPAIAPPVTTPAVPDWATALTANSEAMAGALRAIQEGLAALVPTLATAVESALRSVAGPLSPTPAPAPAPSPAPTPGPAEVGDQERADWSVVVQQLELLRQQQLSVAQALYRATGRR